MSSKSSLSAGEVILLKMVWPVSASVSRCVSLRKSLKQEFLGLRRNLQESKHKDSTTAERARDSSKRNLSWAYFCVRSRQASRVETIPQRYLESRLSHRDFLLELHTQSFAVSPSATAVKFPKSSWALHLIQHTKKNTVITVLKQRVSTRAGNGDTHPKDSWAAATDIS